MINNQIPITNKILNANFQTDACDLAFEWLLVIGNWDLFRN